jgi:hypothetical protein
LGAGTVQEETSSTEQATIARWIQSLRGRSHVIADDP